MVDVKMWRRRRQPNHSDGRRAECPATAPRRGTQKRAPGGPETNLETEQEEQNMKKRLLSAALALAMVLTMLPLSVFAAAPTEGTTAPESGKQTVTYYATKMAGTDTNSGHGIGWYYSVTDKGQTIWHKVESGLITGTSTSGTWYKDIGAFSNDAPASGGNKTLKSTSFTLLGDLAIDKLVQNISVDLNGKTLTVTAADMSKVTSVTVTDNLQRHVDGGTTKGTLGWAIANSDASNYSAFTLDATNCTITSINLTNPATHTLRKMDNVTVTNGVTLKGTGTNASGAAVSAAQSITATNKSSLGAVMVEGNNSNITLTDTTTAALSLTGLGTRLTVNGSSTVGVVTLLGSDSAKTGTAPTVTINSGTVASIGNITGKDEALTSNYNVTIGAANVGGASVTGAITIDNANLTINRSAVGGKITVKNGAVKIAGNNASVGDVAIGGTDATASLSVTGSYNTVGAITGEGTLTLSIPADNTNAFTSVKLNGYTGHGVQGGTWTTAPDENHLSTTLRYQLVKDNKTTFYTRAQLGDALTAQVDPKTNTITIVGQTGGSQEITFMNGNKEWGKIKTTPNTSITLPSMVNGVKVNNWTDGTYTIAAGSNYSTPNTGNATLNAQASTTDVTKLTGVSTNTDDIRAELKGNVITLSGSVTKASGTVTVNLVTDLLKDDGTYMDQDVIIVYDTTANTIIFANPGSAGLDGGMTLENNFTVLRLSNGTTYTLNGSGLKMRATGITVEDGNGASTGDIVATINISGYTAGQKEALKTLIEGGATPFKWADSPAVKQAINAALVTITTSQVDSWRTQAQRAAWQAKNSGTPTAADLSSTGFTDVVLIPYLAVNVTAYNANGTMTATMVPSYRVVVKNPTNGDYKDVFKDKNTGDADANYIVKAGTSLGTLGGEFGKVEVTFNLAAPFVTAYMHQDSTYVYQGVANTFTINHAGKTGLGTVVLNTTAPLVSMKRVSGANGPDGKPLGADAMYYYDSLQAAVDDTLPQADDKVDVITVTAAYTGSGAINVTGLARKFKITTVGNTTISSAASGGLVDVTGSGHDYTIQLLKNNVTNATITVNTATGGSATVSSSSAKPGDTVTVTPKAVNGYKVSGVTAVTNTGANVPVKANSNGTYTFTVPANATKVTVTPKFVASENRVFPDVDPKSWYGPSVKYCYETTVRGVRLMEGDANGNFAPNAKLTRAQMVQMLYNLAGRPTVTGNCPFPDVVGTGYDWAAAPITWAAQKGYVIGYSDGKFHPEVNVSRQDMVLILYRYAKQPAIGASGSLSGYYDASSVGSWAYDAVRWAASMGILSGTNSVALNGYINGPVRANRCEVAVTLANFHRLYG